LWSKIDEGLHNLSSNIVGNLAEISQEAEQRELEEENKNEFNAEEAGSSINNSFSEVKNKFGFSNEVTNNVNEMINAITNTSELPKFVLNVSSPVYTGEVTVIDFSWYEPYKTFGDNIICIFAYSTFLWHVFLKLPDIINGVGASEYTNFDGMRNEISHYKSFGVLRSKHM